MTRSGIGALFFVAANHAKMTGPVCGQTAGMVRCVLTLLPGYAQRLGRVSVCQGILDKLTAPTVRRVTFVSGQTLGRQLTLESLITDWWESSTGRYEGWNRQRSLLAASTRSVKWHRPNQWSRSWGWTTPDMTPPIFSA